VFELFRTLWPNYASTQGYLSLWFNPSKLSKHIPISILDRIGKEDIDELRDVNETDSVYFGLGLRRSDLGPDQRGTKGDVIDLPAFCLDIDLQAPEGAHKADNDALPPSIDEAGDKLLMGGPPPTAIIETGYGLHVYWAFKEPWRFDHGGAKGAAAAFKKFQQGYIERAKKLGWHVDLAASIDRVWRVPGFYNRKLGLGDKDPLVRDRWLEPSIRYGVEELVAVKKPAPTAPTAANPHGTFSVGSIPIIEHGDRFDTLRKSLANLQNDESREMFRAILAGESFAPGGERDAALQRACSIIAWLTPARPFEAEDLAELFRPSLAVWAAEPGAQKTLDEEIAKVVDKIARAKEDFERKQGVVIDALSRLVKSKKKPDDNDPALKDFVLSNLIIQFRSSYYVFDVDRGCYQRPAIKEELPLVLRDALKNAPIERIYEDDKGKIKTKGEAKLIQDYGTKANEVVIDLTIPESIFEVDTRTFREATAPLRDLEPKFDPAIAQWLDHLGGDDSETLLDWIATVADLDQQNCALYLSGSSGAGKSILAHGLARLWHKSGPTEMADTMSSFNEDISRCPLIFADEGNFGRQHGDSMSSMLRSLIGSTSRPLRRKFLPNVRMDGALRVIIAANNESVLAKIADEDMSIADLEAIVSRFLHIKVGTDAVNYLSMLKTGDPEIIFRWIADGIAQHALWLRDNRVITPGKRFLVEGEVSEIHRSLVSEGSVSSLVCEFLVRLTSNPALLEAVYKTSQKAAPFRIGNGRLLVNVQALFDGWLMYMRNEIRDVRIPSMRRLSLALKNMASGTRRTFVNGQKLRMHEIHLPILASWAEAHQVGDDALMAQNLARPIEEDPEPPDDPTEILH
jgi:hypothetical protein